MYRYQIILIIVAAAILITSSALYIRRVLKLRRIYQTYLNKPGPLSGMEAAALMMQRNGYEAQFMIYKGPFKTPFDGNYYLPDKNIFIMRREIMDGKSILSLCVGCQLAASALRYKNGDMCRDRAVEFEGEYALEYVFDEEELINLDETYLRRDLTNVDIL